MRTQKEEFNDYLDSLNGNKLEAQFKNNIINNINGIFVTDKLEVHKTYTDNEVFSQLQLHFCIDKLNKFKGN